VETGGSKILLDSGPGTMKRLLQAKVGISEVTHIFYSHTHPDHTGELVTFLFSSRYPGNLRRKKPLTIIAGKGFSRFFAALESIYGKWIDIGEQLLEIVELDNTGRDEKHYSDFTVSSLPMEHLDESVAFRIEDVSGKTVVYSGDTDYSENLVRISRNADVLICESALPDEMKVQGHLTPSLAGKIAKEANVKKLVLTHLYPECDQVDMESQCRKTWRGELILAVDLLKFRP
jgi:ribonuclease BN (tRNA processing enzyme)